MSTSKAWDWTEEKNPIWLAPSEESYYIAERWKKAGYTKLLDLGCGLGRHSIFFAGQGFSVSAFDLAQEAISYLQEWAGREKLKIDTQLGDMISLPYPSETFDAIFAYHVISHTTTAGIEKIIAEIKRVTKPKGEMYLTLCSKETWSFTTAGYPQIDENTVLKTDDGPEKNIPHFYVNLDDIVCMFADAKLDLLRIRHTDDCYFDGTTQNSKHYFVLAQRP